MQKVVFLRLELLDVVRELVQGAHQVREFRSVGCFGGLFLSLCFCQGRCFLRGLQGGSGFFRSERVGHLWA